MGEYGNFCKVCCEWFNGTHCVADYNWLTQPPLCETLEWEMLEEMAEEAMKMETEERRK